MLHDDTARNRRIGIALISLSTLCFAALDATDEQLDFPILYGSATRQIGIAQLLDAVADYLPAPAEEGEMVGNNPVTGEVEKRSQDPSAPFSA